MAVSPTYCVLPFIHMAVANNGSVSPCCLSQDDLFDPEGRPYSVAQHSLDEIWMSKDMEKLREDLLNGVKSANCARCWTDERLGILSKRQRDNQLWKRHYGFRKAAEAPYWLDLNLGNLCNLKCRICSPISSSKWAQEMKELNPDFDLASLQSSMKWSADPDSLFWQSMNKWLPRIEHFDIYGGEPLLSKPHFEILEKSVREGYSKYQSIHYNTNGTIFPEKIAREVWPAFKHVNVMFSIDGVGDRFEYQRFPAKWDVLESNIRKFKEFSNLKIDICFTINAMNLWYFPEFHRWAEKQGLQYWVNYLDRPPQYSPKVYPDESRRKICAHIERALKTSDKYYSKQIQPLLNFIMDNSFSEDLRQTFLAEAAMLDKHRRQDFKSVFPESYELITASSVSGESSLRFAENVRG